MNKFNVLYIVNIPSPYMVDYFNELGKKCNLTVIFEKSTSRERDKSWSEFNFINFMGIILKGPSISTDTAFCPQIVKYLKKHKYDFIFISNMASPTGIIAINYLKSQKIEYFLESEGGFAKDGKRLKEKFKRRLMSNAKGYFSTSVVGDKYFLTYGAPKEKIYRYPFTSLHEEDVLSAPITENEKTKLKRKLNFKEEKIVLSVGRFITLKRFDVLIKARQFLDENTGICIIGGEPTEEYLSIIKELNLTNIHFVDFISKDELEEYYKMADLFAFTTSSDVWGLVINEAMAYALPIISTDMCIAGLELVKDDENGYIVPVGDVDMLAEKINYILKNDDTREKMSQSSLEKIKPYTIENMAKVHMDIFQRIKSDI